MINKTTWSKSSKKRDIIVKTGVIKEIIGNGRNTPLFAIYRKALI